MKNIFLNRSEIAKLSDLAINKIINDVRYCRDAKVNAIYIKEMRKKAKEIQNKS